MRSEPTPRVTVTQGYLSELEARLHVNQLALARLEQQSRRYLAEGFVHDHLVRVRQDLLVEQLRLRLELDALTGA